MNTKYMSLGVFTFMVNTVKELLDNSSKFNDDMSKVLGRDSQVISEINYKTIENVEMFLTEHFNDNENRWVEYLIWEVVVGENDQLNITFEDGTVVTASIESIYDILIEDLK